MEQDRRLRKEARSLVESYLKKQPGEPKEETFRSLLRETIPSEKYSLVQVDAIAKAIVEAADERLLSGLERENSREFRKGTKRMEDLSNMLLVAGLTGVNAEKVKEMLASKFNEPGFMGLSHERVSAEPSVLGRVGIVRELAKRILGKESVTESDIHKLVESAKSVREVFAASNEEREKGEFKLKIRRGLEHSGPFRRIVKQMIDRGHLPSP